MRLIIPAAKVVPEELQKLGKLPAIIYPINQSIVFDYLYEQYNAECDEIDIVCYEKIDKVRRRLSKYEETNKIKIIGLPQLDDLGHTIWYALEGVEEPVIINFADTIVMDSIFSTASDAFFYSEDFLSETWTYFEEENGLIRKIIDKQNNLVDDNKKHKLFVGVFRIQQPHKFRDCLEHVFTSRKDNVSSFYAAVELYSQDNKFLTLKTNNWFDIGHADNYYSSKLEVKAREFNHIVIDKDRGILKKTSDDVDKFIGEIKWYLKLPADVEYVRPRIFSYSTSYNNPYVSMEYYSYHTVHELFLYGDLNKNQWIDIFNRIRFVCNDFKKYELRDVGLKETVKDMYLDKTFQRFAKLRIDHRFERLFSNPIMVNGKIYKSLDEISKVLSTIVPEFLFDVDAFNIIHGDLCFANIMVDNTFSFIKVIDPRGKFGAYDIYGDFRYELAKLFHSIDGKYDFIIKDLFTIQYDLQNCAINYVVSDRKCDYDLYEIFCEVFSKEIGGNLRNIELIESLLFLSMIPLHGESLNHQMAMLATGLEILSRVTDEIVAE